MLVNRGVHARSKTLDSSHGAHTHIYTDRHALLTIFPEAKMRAVVLGSRMRMMTAAKRCGGCEGAGQHERTEQKEVARMFVHACVCVVAAHGQAALATVALRLRAGHTPRCTACAMSRARVPWGCTPHYARAAQSPSSPACSPGSRWTPRSAAPAGCQRHRGSLRERCCSGLPRSCLGLQLVVCC